MKCLSLWVAALLVVGCVQPLQKKNETDGKWALETVRIVQEPSFIAKGTSTQVKVVGLYDDDLSVDLTHHVVWESSNEDVLDVSKAGFWVGRKTGVATVTARLGVFSDSTEVAVTHETLTQLTIQPAFVEVPVGVSQRFKVIGTFSDGSTRDVTSQAYLSTDDPNRAAVVENEDGMVKAHDLGRIGVTARLNGISSYSIMDMTGAVIEELVLEGANFSIPAGNAEKLTAWGRFSDGSIVDLSEQATWGISNTQVASVNQSGEVKGWNRGEARVTAEFGEAIAHVTVDVQGVALQDIVITTSANEIAKGESVQVHAYGHFADGSVKDLTSAVTWYSSDPMVFDPTSITGTGKTLAAGIATVYAEFTPHVASKRVKVGPARIDGMEVDISDTRMTVGSTLQLQAFARLTDGTFVDITHLATWACGVEDSLTVSNAQGTKGLVEALIQPGPALVSLAYNGFTAFSLIEVTDAVIENITIQPTTIPTGFVGGLALEAIAKYSDGVEKNVTNRVVWESSDANVATISDTYGTRGSVNVTGSGSVVISATVDGVQGVYSASLP